MCGIRNARLKYAITTGKEMQAVFCYGKVVGKYKQFIVLWRE